MPHSESLRTSQTLHLVAVLAVGGVLACSTQRNSRARDSAANRASVAAHALSQDVGPIWPYNSTCFVPVESARVAGHVPAAPRWTVENRPLVDTSKPATTRVAVRD